MRAVKLSVLVAIAVTAVAISAVGNSRNLGYFAGVVCGSVATETMRTAR